MGRTTDAPTHAALAAGLHYTLDDRPGFSRVRAGKGFVYRDTQGRVIREAQVLPRIRGLALPPAWTDGRIVPPSTRHPQPTGRDTSRRKQYPSHPRGRQVRDETKYQRLLEFARLLPRLLARVQDALGQPGLPRRKVI